MMLLKLNAGFTSFLNCSFTPFTLPLSFFPSLPFPPPSLPFSPSHSFPLLELFVYSLYSPPLIPPLSSLLSLPFSLHSFSLPSLFSPFPFFFPFSDYDCPFYSYLVYLPLFLLSFTLSFPSPPFPFFLTYFPSSSPV